MRFLVTGGAGFIGSNYVRHLVHFAAETQVDRWYRAHEDWWRPVKPAGASRTLDHGR